MKNTKIFLIAALLGTVLASCQKEVDVKEEKPVETKGWTLTVKANMDQTTKAMSLEGNTLTSKWEDGEVVGVYLGTTKVGTLTASNTSADGSTTELSGTLQKSEGDFEVTDNFILIFPDKDVITYLGQDGSSPADASKTMANNFDYARAIVGIASIDESTKVITAGDDANFTSLQSIYRLRFKEGSTYFNVNSISITAQNLGLVRTAGPLNALENDSDCGTLTMFPTVTPSENNYYYMAIRNESSSDDVYSFTVVRASDNAVLTGTKAIESAVLASPTYVRASVEVSQKTMTLKSTEISDPAEVL